MAIYSIEHIFRWPIERGAEEELDDEIPPGDSPSEQESDDASEPPEPSAPWPAGPGDPEPDDAFHQPPDLDRDPPEDDRDPYDGQPQPQPSPSSGGTVPASRQDGSVQVLPQSQLTARQLVDMIHSLMSIPQYMRDAIQVDPHEPSAIRVSGIADRDVPAGHSVPDWFNGLITASRSGDWAITTGQINNTITEDRTVRAQMVPDISRSMSPGRRVPDDGGWAPSVLDMYSRGAEAVGQTFPSEVQAATLNEIARRDGQPALEYGGPTVRGDRGLIVVGNRYVSPDRSGLTQRRSDSEIVNTLFHESAVHAGRISAGMTHKHESENPRAEVEQWTQEINRMFRSTP